MNEAEIKTHEQNFPVLVRIREHFEAMDWETYYDKVAHEGFEGRAQLVIGIVDRRANCRAETRATNELLMLGKQDTVFHFIVSSLSVSYASLLSDARHTLEDVDTWLQEEKARCEAGGILTEGLAEIHKRVENTLGKRFFDETDLEDLRDMLEEDEG